MLVAPQVFVDGDVPVFSNRANETKFPAVDKRPTKLTLRCVQKANFSGVSPVGSFLCGNPLKPNL